MDALSIQGLHSFLIGRYLMDVADLGSSLFNARLRDLFVDQEPDLDSISSIVGRESRNVLQRGFGILKTRYSSSSSTSATYLDAQPKSQVERSSAGLGRRLLAVI